jgi:hypothetical protein
MGLQDGRAPEVGFESMLGDAVYQLNGSNDIRLKTRLVNKADYLAQGNIASILPELDSWLGYAEVLR